MSTISKVVLPVKDPSTGVITNTEFDLPSGGSFSPVITNPTDGQLLKYDASQGAWVNAGISTTTETVGSASAGTAIKADDITAWSAGSVPTLGTAIAADDITAWSAGSMTTVSVSGEKLTVTNGTAPSLSYTARSIPNVTSVGTAPSLSYTERTIPNISVTNKTVVKSVSV